MLFSTNSFSICNTFFKHKRIHKMTWFSPGSASQNELEYVSINWRWCSSLQDIRSYRGAHVGSHHFLVVGKIRLKLKKVKKVQPKWPYAVDRPKNTNVSKSYCEELKRLAVIQHPPTIEEQWSLFSWTMSQTVKTVLDRRKGTNKKMWITTKTCKLIDEKKIAKINRRQKRRLLSWRIEYTWALTGKWRRLKELTETQEAGKKNNTKTLCRIVRKWPSSSSSSGVPIMSKDGVCVYLSKKDTPSR